MDKAVIEGSGDGGRRDSEKACDKACEFKVSEVARDHDFGAWVQGELEHFSAVGQFEVFVPILSVYFSRCVGDLAEHQDQMFPHLLLGPIGFRFGPFRENALKVVLDQGVSDSNHSAHECCEQLSEPFAAIERQRLDQGDDQPKSPVGDSILPRVRLMAGSLHAQDAFLG